MRLVPGPTTPSSDPFVRQLTWLVTQAGGKDALVRASGGVVGVRTLDNWARGDWPRSTVSGAVRELDAWAASQDLGYPEAAGAPRLTASCGPGREVPAEPVAPTAGRRRWRWAMLGLGQVAVVAATVGLTLAVTRADPAPTDGLLGVLPSIGDGDVHPLQVGGADAVTWSDPRGLTAGGPAVPAGTAVGVRCRFQIDSLPGNTGGWFYLVDTGVWAGTWAAASRFTDGSHGEGTVPECTTALSAD